MQKIWLLLVPAIAFGSIKGPSGGFEDALFSEGFKSYGQTRNSKDTPNDVLERILKNPDKLISDTFYIPENIRGRVLFWANIYATYPSNTVVIHDKNDPSVVYEVLDLSYIFNDKRLNDAGKEVRFNKAVSDKKQQIKNILRTMSKDPKNYFASNNEQKNIKRIAILSMRKGFNIKTAWQNVRVQTGQKDNILNGLKNSFKYLPIIEDIFKESGLPWELTRIPFVESSFNIQANSKVGAKGIWQIMGDTGKNFMQTKASYDERYSPFKASAVAAMLLKENYDILKTWPLAITAYNHGPSGLKRAAKELKTKDIGIIISKYNGRYFGFASQNFYSEFLAALYVTVYYEKVFGHIEKGHPLNFYYVGIEKDITVADISRISGLSLSEISSYNPEFSKKMLKGEIPISKGSKIKLPARASYKVEDYFVKMSDKYKLERELNINEPEDN